MLYKGTLNVYFPCELKNSQEIKHMRRMWNDVMQGQRNLTRTMRLPNTNQMDVLAFRQQKEQILKVYQAIWAARLGATLPDGDAGCYATSELANEYRHPREDNLFVKSISLRISSFDVEYNHLTKNNKNVSITGQLLFSVNLDNNVATAILVLNFKNLNVDDVILLKHTFYKRCHVSIIEKGIRQDVNTFQEYVTSKLRPIYPFIKADIDSRARYMLMDVSEPIVNYQNQNQRNSIIYGMLTCDEGWRHSNGVLDKDCSTRDAYQLYFNSKNAIIVTAEKEYSKYVQEKIQNWKRIEHAPNHIESPYVPDKCDIAGVDKQLFAKYLKNVELDYLITNALTSEISKKIEKNLFNPIKLLYRASKLWKILNDLDLNLYHKDEIMLNSFGVTKNIADIRQENNEIVDVITNYLLLLVAILTLLATII